MYMGKAQKKKWDQSIRCVINIWGRLQYLLRLYFRPSSLCQIMANKLYFFWVQNINIYAFKNKTSIKQLKLYITYVIKVAFYQNLLKQTVLNNYQVEIWILDFSHTPTSDMISFENSRNSFEYTFTMYPESSHLSPPLLPSWLKPPSVLTLPCNRFLAGAKVQSFALPLTGQPESSLRICQVCHSSA